MEQLLSREEKFRSLILGEFISKPKTSYLVCIDIDNESELRIGSLQTQLQRAGFRVTNLCRTEQFEEWKEFEAEQKRIENKGW